MVVVVVLGFAPCAVLDSPAMKCRDTPWPALNRLSSARLSASCVTSCRFANSTQRNPSIQHDTLDSNFVSQNSEHVPGQLNAPELYVFKYIVKVQYSYIHYRTPESLYPPVICVCVCTYTRGRRNKTLYRKQPTTTVIRVGVHSTSTHPPTSPSPTNIHSYSYIIQPLTGPP